LAEIAGDAAVIVDPEDVDAMRERLRRLLTESILRDDLRKRGTKQASVFSWERTATLVMSAIR
jgi:glycosyltransferase involved in cell wall biosynthesis